MAEHTRGEWFAAHSAVFVPQHGLGNQMIAQCWFKGIPTGETQANAEFIARAVNCHEELLAALEALVDASTEVNPQVLAMRIDRAAPGARAAIAKAKGGP